MLRSADNKTGYFGVCLSKPGRPKPYDARVYRGGKTVHLGRFATAKEAALCVARSVEGWAVAEGAAAAPPLTSKEVLQQAQAERLTLLKAENKTGYFGVYVGHPGAPRPYLAQVRREGKNMSLGYFATAEEAALCIVRSPEGQAVARKPAAAPPTPPLTSEEVRQQAQAEGLTLRVADNTSGFFGVHYKRTGRPRPLLRPYQAKLRIGGTEVILGCFSTAEEAALCVARSLEGPPAAGRAAAPSLTSENALQEARDATIRAAALDIIYQAAGAATAELSAEVAAEVMAGIAMGL